MRQLATRLGRPLNSHRGGIIAALLTFAMVYSGNIEWVENRSLAALFEWVRGPRSPQTPIVIVAIDETTFVEIQAQWPYPRVFHAEVISRLAEFKPLVIGVDIIFDQPSNKGPDDDLALAEALKLADNVVLGSAPKDEETEVEGAPIGRQYRMIRKVPNLPIPVIRKGAAAVAPVNLDKDPSDGKVRRAPLRVQVGDKWDTACDAMIDEFAAKAG